MGSLWFECLCLNQYHHEFLNIMCLMVLVLFMWIQLLKAHIIGLFKSMQLLCHFPHLLTPQQALVFWILFFHSNGEKRKWLGCPRLTYIFYWMCPSLNNLNNFLKPMICLFTYFGCLWGSIDYLWSMLHFWCKFGRAGGARVVGGRFSLSNVA